MKSIVQKTGIALVVALVTGLGVQPSWAGGNYGYKHGNRGHQGHYYGYPYRGSYNYRRHNSDDDEKLIYGLLVGGLFGYVIGNANQAANNQPDYAPPQTGYTPPATPDQYSGPASTCLQEREYQMKVIVGGKQVDAYGTACLQPDGSWYRGPAKVVSR
jgi:hypothetical protein